MRHPYARRVLSLLSSLLMAISLCAPAAAWAKDVEVANHTQPGGATVVSGLRIDGVSAPVPGCALDGTATVTAEPGAAWEVPVLWVRDDLELATTAEEGRDYLPAIAFFVPEGYALEGDAYEVALSESLTALFGGAEVVSVYDAATGVTYILPASLRAFFGRRATAEAAGRVAEGADVSQGGADTGSAEAAQVPAGVEQGNPRPCPGGPDKGMVPDQGEEPEEGEDKPKPNPGQSLVEVYCAQTVMDAISEEDLEWLCDLVVTRLEPQAANLLAESFPAFANASADELGTEIGLYVYYSTGDKDGVPEHDNISPGVAAFVVSTADSSQRYCYMIGVNAMGLQAIDEDGNLVRDEATGKLRLARDGSGMVELENTIVHELLHAFMDDYNRTGMAGVTNIKEYVATQDWESMTGEQKECFKTVSFPTWFIEGTATTTENVFQARHPLFDGLRKGVDGEMRDRYTQPKSRLMMTS